MGQQIRRYRLDAVRRGLCYVCRCRFPRAGLRNCDQCLARTRAKTALYVADGRCRCGREPRLGHTTCARCAEQNRVHRLRRQARQASEGRCSRCVHLAAPERTMCFGCLAALRERARTLYAKTKGGRL